MATPEENKAIIRDYLDAFGKFDKERVLALVAEDAWLETPTKSAVGGKKTRAHMASEFDAIKQVLPHGVDMTILSMTAEEDRVHCEVSGTAKTIDGQSYDNRYHYAFQVRDGKISRFVEYMDTKLVEDLIVPTFQKAGATNIGN